MIHVRGLDAQIEAFAEHYNYRRYRENLAGVMPADAYFGRAPAIIEQCGGSSDRLENRRLQH